MNLHAHPLSPSWYHSLQPCIAILLEPLHACLLSLSHGGDGDSQEGMGQRSGCLQMRRLRRVLCAEMGLHRGHRQSCGCKCKGVRRGMCFDAHVEPNPRLLESCVLSLKCKFRASTPSNMTSELDKEFRSGRFIMTVKSHGA